MSNEVKDTATTVRDSAPERCPGCGAHRVNVNHVYASFACGCSYTCPFVRESGLQKDYWAYTEGSCSNAFLASIRLTDRMMYWHEKWVADQATKDELLAALKEAAEQLAHCLGTTNKTVERTNAAIAFAEGRRP